MEALIIPFLLVLFALLAFRCGHDSRPTIRSQEERLADAGFLFDRETTSVMPDAPTAATSLACNVGGRVAGLPTG
jgi:hypothetical protein